MSALHVIWTMSHLLEFKKPVRTASSDPPSQDSRRKEGKPCWSFPTQTMGTTIMFQYAAHETLCSRGLEDHSVREGRPT